jgi:hypothetical protein
MPIQCLRCGAGLAKLGRREVHYGPLLRHDPTHVHKLATDVMVCQECGHLEFFDPKFGAPLRAEDSDATDEETAIG